METQTLSSIAALLLACFLVSAVAGAASAADSRRDACARVEEQIRKLETRMRRGYTAAEGVRLEERLRELKDKRYRLCR